LEERFAKRGMKMSANNAKQADVLTSAAALPNSLGTRPASGSAQVRRPGAAADAAAGPPYEMKAMFEAECIPRLRARVPVQHIATRTFKMAMMPESQVDARSRRSTKPTPTSRPRFLAGAGEIQLHLRCRKDSQPEAEARVEELSEKIEDELADSIFSRKGETIEQNRQLICCRCGA